MVPVPSQHLHMADIISKSVESSDHLTFHFRGMPMEINGRCAVVR
jgi:hypothetical protein